jgi:acyl carrier protein
MQEVLDRATIAEVLKEVSAELRLNLEDVSFDTELSALGMDSFAQLELVAALEDRLSFRVPNEEISKITTISSLLDCLVGVQSAAEGKATEGAGGERR